MRKIILKTSTYLVHPTIKPNYSKKSAFIKVNYFIIF